MREERRRMRGRAGRLGIWLTARPGRLLHTILPEGGGGGEVLGLGTWVRGAGVPAPDWPTGEDAPGAGCTMVQRRRHGALLVLLLVRKKA